MRQLIRRNIKGKNVLILFIVTNIVYVFMLTVTIPKVMSFSQGMNLLDLMPTGYNPEYVKSLFLALGEEGRDAYLFRQIPVDMIYPFLFGVSSCLVLAYFLSKLQKLEGPLFYFCFVPLFSGVFDYCENMGIIRMLNSCPDLSDLLINITSVFSIVKSSCTVCYFIILAILLVAFGISRLSRKAS